MRKRDSKNLILCFSVILAFLLSFSLASALNIDPVDKYAWGENIGWINFGSVEGDVDVYTNAIDGYAWGENVGWISLNCSNTASCGTVDYGITISGSTVSGYAWGENIGWISFNCLNTSSCGTVDYGVTFDPGTGVFSGYAWGENVGWIVFNCTTTSSCGTVDYRLKMNVVLITTAPTPSGGGGPSGGGFLPSPSPSVAPTVSPTGTFEPGTPAPTVEPGTTPTGTPPAATPTGSPSPIGPIVVGVVTSVGDFLDRLARLLFGDACVGSLGLAACTSTALTTLSVVLALLAALIQGEWIVFFWNLRRAPVWGVVYESVTKMPVAYPKVELLDNENQLLETTYGNRDGRYGFVTVPSSLLDQHIRVHMKVSKPGFRFPTRRSIPAADFIVYENSYHGSELVLDAGKVPNINIPVDANSPVRMRMTGLGRSVVGRMGDRILWLAFFVGVIAAPLYWWFMRTQAALVIGAIFIVVSAIRLKILYRPYGVTRDAYTGKPLPYALVILNDMKGNRLDFAVSDEHGRYILKGTRSAEYGIVAYTPSDITPRRSVVARVRAKKGLSAKAWIQENLRV